MVDRMNSSKLKKKIFHHNSRGSFLAFFAIGSLSLLPATESFIPLQIRRQQIIIEKSFQPSTADNGSRSTIAPSSALFMAGSTGKLWERLEIEEDDEKYWYVLNCVAGLEIDLLRQCRATCENMEDVEKFVVPTITTTRSHGANRMVQDTKVKYQGYVFAKLRLCQETYEVIQGLDLCRSWMGTINMKGLRKLPPCPVILNEEEIENFGLEKEEHEEPQDDGTKTTVSTAEGEEVDVILDSEEQDNKDAEMEEVVQTLYLGLRVDDMIKVTAHNKFFNEDGVVRRLKDGKIFVRFYTYGSTFEEWLDPSDVRKLDEIEVLKGLTGPDSPITQQDLDGPKSRYDDGPRDRRNMDSGFGGGRGGRGERNRRQDRVGRQYRDNDRYDDRKERENWNWYQDTERKKRGGGFSDGDDVEIRGSIRNTRNDWAGSDVDSQWGRGNQRGGRGGDRRPRGQERQVDDKDDWSAFVSPASSRSSSSGSGGKEDTDDFFASLMTDLSKNLDSDDGGSYGGEGGSSVASGTTDASSASDDDDFFASLMSEISEEDTSSKPSPPSGGGSSSKSDDVDDFFATWANEDSKSTSPRRSNKQQQKTSSDTSTDLDDFFAEISSEAGLSEGTNGDEADDFFASLEAELDTELSSPSIESFEEASSEVEFMPPMVEATEENTSSSKPKAKKTSLDSSSTDVREDFSKLTVPTLKVMLKERGLKVSGKKADLIERLTASQ